MNISGISGGFGSVRECFQRACSSGGITKDSLTKLQNELESKDESAAAKVGSLLEAFDQIDADGSAEIEKAEMETYMRQMGLRPPCGPPKEGEAPELTQEQLSEMAEESGDSGLAQVASSFEEADTNGDGSLSQAEFEAYAEANGIARPEPPQGAPPPLGGEEEEEDDEDDAEENAAEVKNVSAEALAKLLQGYVNFSNVDLTASLWEGLSA